MFVVPSELENVFISLIELFFALWINNPTWFFLQRISGSVLVISLHLVGHSDNQNFDLMILHYICPFFFPFILNFVLL